ncbi:MAG: serine/threonine-protein kinase [Terracidiphilus sp.]|jgi:serine/threonine-protein kinase
MGVPKVIGRYEIVEELGRGAMGSVFKARDPAVGRIVALKTIHTAALEGAQSEEYRARFYREARASGVLAHPGIVPVFDVGEDAGAPFLVMEFVEGRTLADAMKNGERYTLDRVCEIGQQLADALGYAHRQGVIHRDIKPANILMTSRAVYGSERPRITDFGIAKLAASEITSTGQLLGTPSFMPPEQFTGSPIDGRADLFSLGVILYSLATGEQPFPGETMTAVSYKVVYTDPIPPAKLNPAIPAGLEAVILKCLAKSPADRYQTGEELARDLAAVRTNAGSVVTQTGAPLLAIAGSDVTLAPGSVASSIPPAAAKAATQPGQMPAQKKPSKPAQFESIFAVTLLCVAGAGAAIAGGWYWYAHRKQPAPPPPQAVTVPVPQPQPTPPVVQPAGTVPPPPVASAPGKSSAAAPPPTSPTPAKPSAAKPVPAKPSPAQPSPVPSKPVVASAPPASANPAPANPQTPAPAAPAAFDPRKADPNKNGKLKIDVSKFPKGLPFTILMNKQPYIHFITGDGSSLDNLYVPPGMQEFRVSFKSAGQEWDTKPVSSDFKAKKTKTLKVQLLENGKAESKITLPITKDAQLTISFSSSLSDIF